MRSIDPLLTGLVGWFTWLPWWAESLALITGCCAVVLPLHGVAFRAMQRIVAGKSLFWRSLVARTHGPSRLALLIVALSAAAAPLTWEVRLVVNQVLLVALVTLCGWCCAIAIHIWSVVYLRGYKARHRGQPAGAQARHAGADPAAGRHHPRGSRHRLGRPDDLRAGAPVRRQPARLRRGRRPDPRPRDAAGAVEPRRRDPDRDHPADPDRGRGDRRNEWGWVEEITATYVVVRLWDWRRLVLPLAYFIQKPFQNWTRDGASLIGSVMLYVDHTAPIEAMRRKLAEIAAGSRLWDGNVVNLQVSDARETVIEVRMLVSARNAPQTWDLRCEVREKMIAYLRTEHPGALPRQRAEWVAPGAEGRNGTAAGARLVA